jgi:hypothetical protein
MQNESQQLLTSVSLLRISTTSYPSSCNSWVDVWSVVRFIMLMVYLGLLPASPRIVGRRASFWCNGLLTHSRYGSEFSAVPTAQNREGTRD